jgi:hypothetical protein
MSDSNKVEDIEELNYFSPENGSYSHFSFNPLESEDHNKIINPNLSDSIKSENILFDENLKCSFINNYLPLNPSEIQNIITGKTEPSSKGFLNKKRNLEKKDKEILDHISIIEENDKDEKEEKETENNNDDGNGKKKRGRRSSDKTYSEEADHNKFKEDNIIRKIKTYTFKYILNALNNSLEKTRNRFYPLDKDLNENIKKDFNMELLDRTIKDIYDNSGLNKRFKNPKFSNKFLIKKIFDEKVEIRTINILNMKYIDILNYIRENDMDNFLETIKEKEKKKQEKNIDLYMEELKNILIVYEKWFDGKCGRNKAKKTKE